MPKCAGCSGGGSSGCACLLTVSNGLILTGDGSLATPWNLNGPDRFSLFIEGTDTNFTPDQTMVAATTGYSDVDSFGKPAGVETINLNPVSVAPGVGPIFSLFVGLASTTYIVLVEIYVSTIDCVSKIKATRSFAVTPDDSEDYVYMGDPGDWNVHNSGTDLSLDDFFGSMIVRSFDGVCLLSQMFVSWTGG